MVCEQGGLLAVSASLAREENITCVVLARIGPQLRLIGDTAIDPNRSTFYYMQNKGV